MLFHDTGNKFKRLQIKRALPVNESVSRQIGWSKSTLLYLARKLTHTYQRFYSHHSGHEEDKSLQDINMEGSIVVGTFVAGGFGCCCCCCKIAAGVNPVMEGVAFTPPC